jgi:monoamine oxidase
MQPRIVIVGGGLAGIRCAHKLWINRRRIATIYEWDDHVGGRVETLRNFFANGQISEQHGEFISSEHASMLSLASRFDLALDNAQVSPPNTNSACWFNGGYYTQKQLNADWKSFAWTLFHSAVLKAPFPTRYNHYNRTALLWDQMSVLDWINKYVPGGMSAPFGRLCYEDALSEYGGPPEQQSALNLIYLLGYDDSASNGYQPKKSPVLAGTDEKYHIKGGNDQLIAGMVGELPAGTIQLSQQLMAVKLNSDGTYTCTFQSGATTHDVLCDHVVLAIPFSTLCKVDLSKANLSALKMTAISNLQLGNNAKIMMQFNSRIWNANGFNGNTFADNGAAVTWETTNYQSGATGILLDFPAGVQGAGLAAKYRLTTDQAQAPLAMVNDTLAVLEPIFPGVTANYNGLAYCNDGNIDPHLLGAYSQYSIGQYTGFSGIEPVQEGNIHFAGEQTSLNFQGFMEGAVTTGERVAGEI